MKVRASGSDDSFHLKGTEAAMAEGVVISVFMLLSLSVSWKNSPCCSLNRLYKI